MSQTGPAEHRGPWSEHHVRTQPIDTRPVQLQLAIAFGARDSIQVRHQYRRRHSDVRRVCESCGIDVFVSCQRRGRRLSARKADDPLKVFAQEEKNRIGEFKIQRQLIECVGSLSILTNSFVLSLNRDARDAETLGNCVWMKVRLWKIVAEMIISRDARSMTLTSPPALPPPWTLNTSDGGRACTKEENRRRVDVAQANRMRWQSQLSQDVERDETI